ncbi:hypothetical protein [Ruminiclostridium hungatei]|nr:hypothetical protein [Ruminiclostridium hungatei]
MSIHFENNNIKDFSVLKDIPNLQESYFAGNPGTDSSPRKTDISESRGD